MVEKDSPSNTPQIVLFDKIASKYFMVWIWSIVVGISTTTSLSLISYPTRSRGSFFVLLMSPLFFLSALCLIKAWYGIIRFFDYYIVPTFFYGESNPKDSERFLKNSVRFSFLSLALRLLLSLVDLTLNVTSF